MVELIITGGQSGGDIAGNILADKKGIPNEVNIFKEFKPTRKEIYPKSTKINYVCDKHHYIGNLACRTQYNVNKADITIILVKQDIQNTKGSKLTSEKCIKLGKNYFVCDIYKENKCYYFKHENFYLLEVIDIKEVKNIINFLCPKIINIAGQRELNNEDAAKFLEKLL